MVYIKKLSELFITLTLYVKQCNLSILIKVQIIDIVADRRLIQKVWNVFKPTITNYSQNYIFWFSLSNRGKIKNLGSPKGGNFYLNTWSSKYKKKFLYGDGASVVGIRSYSKGKQFFKATNRLTYLKDTSMQ